MRNLSTDEVRLNVIHTGIGDISQSDVMLASASNAIVIGFHVSVTANAAAIAEKEQVDVRLYEVIYQIQEAIKKALDGLLEPETIVLEIGMVEVRQVFKVSKVGTIAGSKVMKGKVIRNAPCRIFRNNEEIYEGKISGLKRFKNDAREVAEGYECGLSVEGFNDFEPGDEVRIFEVQERARSAHGS